jgi:hypothetical protein
VNVACLIWPLADASAAFFHTNDESKTVTCEEDEVEGTLSTVYTVNLCSLPQTVAMMGLEFRRKSHQHLTICAHEYLLE